MTSALQAQLRHLADDLARIFGPRLEAVVGYGRGTHVRSPSLALVRSLSVEDLTACAARTTHWHRQGCATPLILTSREFARSLDAFPIEYGEILATAELIAGADPFQGLSIARDDLRRACEVQVKSHLLHLREDYLEGGGRPGHITALVRESAPAFAMLLRHLAVLDNAPAVSASELSAYAAERIGLDRHVVGDLISLSDGDGMPAVDAVRIFPAYLAAVERVAEFIDQWRQR
jgi:hypothetical protein